MPMIVKELTLPTRILADMALLRRLPDGHAKKQLVKDDLARRQAGYSGERNLRYYLGLLPKNKYRIFFDIYLSIHQHNFQIDTLLIASKFTLVIEVKNFKGTLFFEPSFNQCIRLINNRKKKATPIQYYSRTDTVSYYPNG
ncbi:nuclease-related domain-containing protein [Terrilactibacillus sp. S3-3]|nr:nuclease-related domain-containing protein [Terrilactibacillus sp. S3-3]